MKMSKKGIAGFTAGAVLGAAGGSYTGPSDEEITQQVNAKAASRVEMIGAVHRPKGACLQCHAPGDK